MPVVFAWLFCVRTVASIRGLAHMVLSYRKPLAVAFACPTVACIGMSGGAQAGPLARAVC